MHSVSDARELVPLAGICLLHRNAKSSLLSWQLSQEQQKPDRRLTARAARRQTSLLTGIK